MGLLAADSFRCTRFREPPIRLSLLHLLGLASSALRAGVRLGDYPRTQLRRSTSLLACGVTASGLIHTVSTLIVLLVHVFCPMCSVLVQMLGSELRPEH